MDAFYVSVEIRDNPELANKPVAVGGKSTSRGVLSTCNYIAREYGIHSAMPTITALRKCPNLIIVPGRMEVYKAISEQLRAIFARYTDKVEPLSLDEAYLDVTACQMFKGSATLIAEDIRSTIANELNLTASAGIAPIKYLAKVASDLNKPDGQYVIPPDQVLSFITTMPLSKIPGVGKVTFEKLKASGLMQGADIIKCDKFTLISMFGKLGQSLWQKCHGIDNREVECFRLRKSLGIERTFTHDISDVAELKKFMLEHLVPELTQRAEKYLVDREIIKLGVKVKFTDFHQTTKEFKYHDYDNNIFCILLKDALKRGKGKAVRLIGIHISLNEATIKNQKQIEFQWS